MVAPPLAQTDPLLATAAGAVLSGGVVSALAAFRRARPQAQLDVVNAAKILYDELRTELTETRKELDQARSELADARAEIREQRSDLQKALQHSDDCERRLGALEKAVSGQGLSIDDLLDPT